MGIKFFCRRCRKQIHGQVWVFADEIDIFGAETALYHFWCFNLEYWKRVGHWWLDLLPWRKTND